MAHPPPPRTTQMIGTMIVKEEADCFHPLLPFQISSSSSLLTLTTLTIVAVLLVLFRIKIHTAAFKIVGIVVANCHLWRKDKVKVKVKVVITTIKVMVKITGTPIPTIPRNSNIHISSNTMGMAMVSSHHEEIVKDLLKMVAIRVRAKVLHHRMDMGMDITLMIKLLLLIHLLLRINSTNIRHTITTNSIRTIRTALLVLKVKANTDMVVVQARTRTTPMHIHSHMHMGMDTDLLRSMAAEGHLLIPSIILLEEEVLDQVLDLDQVRITTVTFIATTGKDTVKDIHIHMRIRTLLLHRKCRFRW
jgi:hypothetical protein